MAAAAGYCIVENVLPFWIKTRPSGGNKSLRVFPVIFSDYIKPPAEVIEDFDEKGMPMDDVTLFFNCGQNKTISNIFSSRFVSYI